MNYCEEDTILEGEKILQTKEDKEILCNSLKVLQYLRMKTPTITYKDSNCLKIIDPKINKFLIICNCSKCGEFVISSKLISNRQKCMCEKRYPYNVLMNTNYDRVSYGSVYNYSLVIYEFKLINT